MNQHRKKKEIGDKAYKIRPWQSVVCKVKCSLNQHKTYNKNGKVKVEKWKRNESRLCDKNCFFFRRIRDNMKVKLINRIAFHELTRTLPVYSCWTTLKSPINTLALLSVIKVKKQKPKQSWQGKHENDCDKNVFGSKSHKARSIKNVIELNDCEKRQRREVVQTLFSSSPSLCFCQHRSQHIVAHFIIDFACRS